MKLPTNHQEFQELLEKHGAANPDVWTKDRKFDTQYVIQYLFLQMIWNAIESPHRSSASETNLEQARKRKETPFSDPDSEVVDILDRMIAAGVTPEEISKVISFKQQSLVLTILYALNDNAYGQIKEVQDTFRFGVFDMDESFNPVPGTGWGSVDHLFYDAVPKDHETVVPKAYLDV